jgi:hypothetical protein
MCQPLNTYNHISKGTVENSTKKSQFPTVAFFWCVHLCLFTCVLCTYVSIMFFCMSTFMCIVRACTFNALFSVCSGNFLENVYPSFKLHTLSSHHHIHAHNKITFLKGFLAYHRYSAGSERDDGHKHIGFPGKNLEHTTCSFFIICLDFATLWALI